MELPPIKAYSLGMLDLPFAVWNWNCEKNIVTGDTLWDSYMGNLAHHAEQENVGWNAFMDPARIDAFYGRLHTVLSSSDKVHFHLIVQESHLRPVEFICHGLVVSRDASGRPLQLMGICRHMFDHEASGGIEHDLSNQSIEDRRRLEALLIQAQRFEGIGKLAGGMAHDLNNLLAPIRMACEILERKNSQQELKRFIEIIQSSCDRARGVIQQILAFSRESESSEVEVIQPAIVLRDLENIVKETFPKRIRLRFDYTGPLPMVRIESTRLHQVLLNLMINARDAIRESGTISIRANRRRFSLRMKVGDQVFHPGDYLCVEVLDSGVGIPREIRSRIFDPFFTTKGKGQGTGLGLASAFGIIANGGGFIDLVSDIGKGSLFTVYLPEATDAESLAQDEDQSMMEQLSGTRVLLIDDEENILNTMKPVMQDWGLEVKTFAHPFKALEHARQFPHDIELAIVDLNMPGMSGEELIREMKECQKFCRFVLMTGEVFQYPESKMRENHVCGLIRKPFLQSELRRAITTCLISGS